MIPREVATFGRYAARRTGLDPEDGESIAGETWAAYPTQEGLWRTITMRRCVDEARRRHGRQGQHRDPLPILDAPAPAHRRAPTPVGDRSFNATLAGTHDPELEQAEIRADLAAILANLDDRDLAALARHYWLGLPADHNRIRTALRRARRSDRAPTAAPTPPAPTDGTTLTVQQARILQLAAAGNTNTQIAAALVLSVNTVKTTMQHACRRLEANDRAHAVALAIRAGLIA